MFRLPELPYAHEALSPVISAETMHVHHDKHHAKYVDTLNALLSHDPARAAAPLEQVIGSAGPGKLYNNAAQAWNHAFFWDSMTPGGSPASDALRTAAEQAFAGWDGLRGRFVDEGVNHFASGWVWLIARGGGLEVVSTHDAGTYDQFADATPLLVCDLWEHAYYIDYRQDRKGFLEAWFDGVADWSFAERQRSAAQAGSGGWSYPAPG